MKKYLYVAANLSLVFFAFCGGMYYGFNEGVDNYYHLEKLLSSNIDVLRAKDLKSGEEEGLKHVYWHFEMSISEGIDAYNWYQKSGNHLFAGVFLPDHLKHLNKSITNIAAYRRDNPVEEDTDLLLCQLLESEQDKEYCLERLEERKQTIIKYGNKS